ncbi:MAG: hypothetical protein FWF98_03150 [Dehalococcoidia bacterium]|nr:hypothetical protein [Dehalococcoidia bacterium]
MEQRGIRTDKGNLNRAIQVTNLKLQQLKTRLVKLQQWLKEEMAKAVLPTLADISGLDKKLEAMIDKQLDISGKLKSVDNRLEVLSEHTRQVGIFLKYKPVYERYKQENHPTHNAEIRAYEAASSYLKAALNGKQTLPTKAWKAEYSRLTAERSELSQQYVSLKDEVREVEQARKSVYELLQGEAREQSVQTTQGLRR